MLTAIMLIVFLTNLSRITVSTFKKAMLNGKSMSKNVSLSEYDSSIISLCCNVSVFLVLT